MQKLSIKSILKKFRHSFLSGFPVVPWAHVWQSDNVSACISIIIYNKDREAPKNKLMQDANN